MDLEKIESRVPDFIGIGSPKCGTTWLFHQLQANPNIFVPPQKELHFFCEWSFDPSNLDRYFMNFRAARVNQKCGEISVNYMESEFSANTIMERLPGVKVFAVIRNPVDLLYSYYWHLKRQNFHCEYTRDIGFEEALSTFSDRLLPPVKIGTNLKVWHELFGARLKVFTVDEVRDRPNWVLDELTDFLFDGDQSMRHGLTKVTDVRSGATPRRGFGPAYRHTYKLLNQWFYMPAKRVFGFERMEALKENLRVRELINKMVFAGRVPPLPETIRKRLTLELLPEINLAERILGRDFNDWK